MSRPLILIINHLKMNKEKNLYQIPDSLKRVLKKGEYAAYQLIDAYYNKDGKFVGRTVGIPNRDVVFNEETGDAIPIGYVQGYSSDGTPMLGSIWFPVESECIVVCLSGVKNASLYNYLEVSNYNESNPKRDTTIPAIYRRIDSLSNAKQTREQRTERVTALRAVISMTNEQVKEFIETNSGNFPVKIVSKPNGDQDWEAIRDSLERWAEQNPKNFLSMTESKKSSDDSEIESLIKKSVEDKIIGFDVDTKSWYGANGKPFLKVNSASKRDSAYIYDLVRYLKTPEGLKVYERLKTASKAQ